MCIILEILKSRSLLPAWVCPGEMSDAAEVLGALYDSLGDVPGGAELVNLVFGLHVRELVHCGSCGRDTHCTRYTQFFYNVSATALRLQGMLNGEDGRLPPLGRLLWVSHRLSPAPCGLCAAALCCTCIDVKGLRSAASLGDAGLQPLAHWMKGAERFLM